MLPGDILQPHRGPRPAIEAESRAWSYAELDDAAHRVADELLALGLDRGDRVSLLCGNEPELVAAYLACFRARLVANPINNRLLPEEVAYILDHAGSRLLLVSDDFAALAERTLPLMKSPPRVMRVDDLTQGRTPGTHPDAGNRPVAVNGVRPRGASPTDGALLIYTSGTTGKPKGVLLTHANVMAGIEIVSRAFEMKPTDRTLCVMPLFHTNGLMFSTLPFLFAGATVILKKRFSATQFWQQCRDARANSTSVSPTILAMLLEHEASAPSASDIHLDFIKVASAPTSVELAQRFEARFGRGLLLETYGLTETTAINVMNPLHGPRKHGSIGRALPPQEVRLVDGEIQVRGPTVMREYFRDPANTQKAMDGEWLRTGDVARIDADGFIFIVGRSKEMILRGGENISPLEIEEIAIRHPAVREAAAVGVPDRIWGETVGLCVVAREPVSEADVVSFCKAHLSPFKVPQRVVFLEELPRNAVGKVTRNALRGVFAPEAAA